MLYAGFGGGCQGRTFADLRVRILKVESFAGVDAFARDDELASDSVSGPRRGYYQLAAYAPCVNGRQTYKAAFVLNSPGTRAELYDKKIKKTWRCGSGENKDRHECLSANAGYRAFTRSQFKWNLCIRTNRYYSGTVAQAHHMLPIAFEGPFRRAGITNIHDPKYGTWWRQPDHSRNTFQYNRRWQVFLRDHPGASVQSILDFACDLADDYGQNATFC